MNMKYSIRRVVVLLLAIVIVVIPLSGIACSDDGGLKAKFKASPSSGDAPLEVTFTDESNGDIDSWAWDFGDGETSTDRNPTHTYVDADTFTVTLTVTDADGKTNTASATINTTGVVYEKMTLVMDNPMPETDPAGIAANKFKELLETYTGGNVKVEVSHGGSLYDRATEFDALTGGSIDLSVIHPAWIQYIDYDLYPIGTLQGAVVNIAHGHALVEDEALTQMTIETWAGYGSHFVGYIDSYLVAGYLANRELNDVFDMEGLKYAMWAPGALGPLEKMIGVDGVYFPQADIPVAITQGNIDVLPTPLTNAWEAQMYQLLDDYLARMYYAPSTIQINLDTWNGMSSELQDLISDQVFPEVQAYIADVVVERHTEALVGLKENLDSVNFVSLEREQELWDMMQTDENFLAEKAKLDPNMYARIEALRPANPTIDQEIIDMLTEAGIPIP